MSILKSLANLGDYCRMKSDLINSRRRTNTFSAVIAIAEQSIAALTARHRVKALVNAEDGIGNANVHSAILRPTPLVCGKLSALLCASLLILSSVHALWLQRLIIVDGTHV